VPEPYQNPAGAFYVNTSDRVVTPLDVAIIIVELNATGSRLLTPPAPGQVIANFIDVNGDNILSSLDALLVINHLNAFGAGQPEPSPADGSLDLLNAVSAPPTIATLAIDPQLAWQDATGETPPATDADAARILRFDLPATIASSTLLALVEDKAEHIYASDAALASLEEEDSLLDAMAAWWQE
jgi:hypothetical protein